MFASKNGFYGISPKQVENDTISYVFLVLEINKTTTVGHSLPYSYSYNVFSK